MKPFIFTKDFYTTFGKGRKIAKLQRQKPSLSRDLECLNVEYDSDVLRLMPEYKLKVLELEKKYNAITEYDYDVKTTKILMKSDDIKDLNLELLEIDYKHKKIDELEYLKRKNDLLNNPWAVFKMNYDEKSDSSNMGIEVVYNKCFIDKLQNMGYTGLSEDDIIESWLSQVFNDTMKEGNFIKGLGI